MRLRFAVVFFFACGSTFADQNTPSGGLGSPAAAADAVLQVPGSQAIPFAEASKQLSVVFPIQISRFDQVTDQSYNWTGETDASLSCQIGFTASALVLSGTVLDDQPLVQMHTRPSRPNWWRITYGADGVEFRIEDITSASQMLHFTLNFGSAGTRPRVELVASPLGAGAGFVQSATLELAELEPIAGEGGQRTVPPAGFRFRAVLPTSGLLEPKFLAGGLLMTVRLHDLDSGDYATYCCMQETVEKTP